MSLQLGFSCDLEQVARPLGRGCTFQPNSVLLLNLKSLDSFNLNHSMPVGLGAEYNLICDLIHISHAWELVRGGLEGGESSSSFGVFSPAHIELFSIPLGPDFGRLKAPRVPLLAKTERWCIIWQ